MSKVSKTNSVNSSQILFINMWLLVIIIMLNHSFPIIVCIRVSASLKNSPLFLTKSLPLKSANCPSPPFFRWSPLYIGFSWHILMILMLILILIHDDIDVDQAMNMLARIHWSHGSCTSVDLLIICVGFGMKYQIGHQTVVLGDFNLDQKLPEHISRINSFVSSLSIYQRSDHSAYIQGAILNIVFDIGWLHMLFWYRRHLVIILQYFSQFRFWIVTMLERRQISKNILGEPFINKKRTFYYLFTHIRNGHNMSYMLVIGIENVSDRTEQVNWCFRTFFQKWWLIY